MEYEDHNSEQTEIVPQDQEMIPTEQPVVQVKDSPSREHFRRLEQAKKEMERELQMQREMNALLMQQRVAPQPQAQPEVDEFAEIADDDFIPKGKVKALAQKEAQRIARDIVQKELQEERKRQHQETFMTKLKSQYTDFDRVVNNDTLAMLDRMNPELARTIAELGDPYKIGLQSYHFIKSMKLHEALEEPPTPAARDSEKKLQQNAKTVQSPQAFSKRPMAQAFRSSREELEAAYREMNHYAGQAGFNY